MQRLVIVAIEQDEVAGPQHGIGDDLVRRAGAVQHEVGLIGAEDPRRMALGFRRRTVVHQQIAEGDVGIAQIVAENAFAEMLEEQLSRR
jgi:hypothetical protein